MPKIRLELCAPLGEGVWLLDRAQERHLIKVLRVCEGTEVEGLLPDGAGGERLLLRLDRTAEGFALREVERLRERPETVRVHLLIGLLKSGQFDTVLRAAGELGLFAVWPVVCARSVPRIPDSEALKKTARWQKILDEGTKISGSVYPPKARPPVLFEDLDWSSLPASRYAALLTAETTLLSDIPESSEELVFAVGPEGDWSPEEERALLENGFTPVGLGSRVLRASTAAIVGCGWFRLMAARREANR